MTLDQGLRNGNYDQWLVGDLPPFIFVNDQSPWCNCQDNNDWNKVEVRVIKLADNEGELEWTWGNLSIDTHSSWKEFAGKIMFMIFLNAAVLMSGMEIFKNGYNRVM